MCLGHWRSTTQWWPYSQWPSLHHLASIWKIELFCNFNYIESANFLTIVFRSASRMELNSVLSLKYAVYPICPIWLPPTRALHSRSLTLALQKWSHPQWKLSIGLQLYTWVILVFIMYPHRRALIVSWLNLIASEVWEWCLGIFTLRVHARRG